MTTMLMSSAGRMCSGTASIIPVRHCQEIWSIWGGQDQIYYSFEPDEPHKGHQWHLQDEKSLAARLERFVIDSMIHSMIESMIRSRSVQVSRHPAPLSPRLRRHAGSSCPEDAFDFLCVVCHARTNITLSGLCYPCSGARASWRLLRTTSASSCTQDVGVTSAFLSRWILMWICNDIIIEWRRLSMPTSLATCTHCE